jgi:hypothetical protein
MRRTLPGEHDSPEEFLDRNLIERHDVLVDVERHRGAGVADPLGHCLRRDALLMPEADPPVAQVVRVEVRNLGADASTRDRVAGRASGVAGESSTGSGKNWAERPGDSRAESTRGPRFSSSVSTKTIPTSIPWERLSPEANWMMRKIVLPLSEGFTENEVARQLRTPRRFVRECLEKLREELEQIG